MENTTYPSSSDNSSFWDDIIVSPLRDSAQSIDRTAVENFENASPESNEIITPPGATGTDVVAVDQGTAVVAEEDNTTAALDVAAMNASVFRGRKRARRTFCDTTTLTFEKFSEYFYLPSEQAAEELQVGREVFKKKCREVGISYWPYRKLVSLDRLLAKVQEFGEIKDQAELQRTIKGLEDERDAILQNPNLDLAEATVRLRDKCDRNSSRKRRYIDPAAFPSTTPGSSSQAPIFSDIPELAPEAFPSTTPGSSSQAPIFPDIPELAPEEIQEVLAWLDEDDPPPKNISDK
ncbi:protein RKD1-like [Ipomoea triloba]|uniref:protein RKD1-like n=1 Tax=Ipomoea triloba TaxID=35885 RepID=UPI00125DCE63|nr:protein RKD1-like [Ipomoea triloba]